MDPRNIAICLAPTLLNMNNLKEIPNSIGSSGPNATNNFLINNQTQLMSRQCNASLDCLTFMIENPKRIFQIPNEVFAKCQFTKSDYSTTLTLHERLGSNYISNLGSFLKERNSEMLKVILVKDLKRLEKINKIKFY